MYQNYFKRTLDFTLALIGLAVISPFFVLLWLLLAIANKGAGVFFTQQRPGKSEKIFKLIKFKTMTDERDETVNRCVELCLASVDHEAEYRALTKDNGFVWVREVVHVLCDEQGQPTALVGFTFDISEHKKVEQFRAELEERNVRLQQRLSLTQDRVAA